MKFASHIAIWVAAGGLILSAIPAGAGTTAITWHGHAAFEIVTPRGAVLMIDPWLNNPVNPQVKAKKDPLAAVKKLDYILVTHGHSDHIGDAPALGRKTGARLVVNFDLGANMVKLLGFPKKQAGFDTLMNPGGENLIADGEVMVSLTPAIHSSGMKNPQAGPNDPDVVYGGNPGGFILRIKGGPTIYHSGDTAYFKDMETIGEFFSPDIALLNIGGHFGMEPDKAALAAKAVGARWAVPHHFGTFPVLTPNAGGFARALQRLHIGFVEMRPGSTITFEGRELR